MKKEYADPFRVSQYLVNLAKKERRFLGITKLLKLLWYCQIEYYQSKKAFFEPESFEAWHYGPVIRSIWIKFSDLLLQSDKSDLTEIDEFEKFIKKILLAQKKK